MQRQRRTNWSAAIFALLFIAAIWIVAVLLLTGADNLMK
jgi:hypothetical protein